MKNFLKTFAPLLLVVLISYLAAVGIREKYEQYFVNSAPPISVIEKSNNGGNGWQLKEPSESAEFISGPLAAQVGELCVFKLNEPNTRADWVIVPPATCYIDSSGSSLAFASNVSSKYTIIAAIVEEGQPKILTHICEYGVSPEPTPSPSPTPTPTPPPQPITLSDWVSKNIPDAGRGQCAALAACYEAAAEGIDKGLIKSPDAAFSVVRMATQTKIKIDIWAKFLDELAVKITEKLDGSNDVKQLGAIFKEIAAGLKTVQDAGDGETKIPFADSKAFSEALKLPSVTPKLQTCSDPTGKACQIPATQTYQQRGNR